MMQEQLDQLSIFSLRELARRTGVSSPTSKKKQQLIDEIIAINNGIKKPYTPKTKQGRPPKTFGYDVGEIFTENLSQVPIFSRTATLNQDYQEYEHVSVFEATGTIETTTNDVGFLWVNRLNNYDCYFIPASIVDGYNLRSGDKVKATISRAGNNAIVKNVLTINDVDYNKVGAPADSYYEIRHVTTKEDLKFNHDVFNDLKINKGDNTYLYGTDNNINTKYAIDMLNDCNVDEKIYINISIAEKTKYVLKAIKNAELFVANITDSTDDVKRITKLAIERAICMFEQKKHVLIVVDDALSVASLDSPELVILKRLMSLAKYTPNASISIIAIMDKYKHVDPIEKLADNKFDI